MRAAPSTCGAALNSSRRHFPGVFAAAAVRATSEAESRMVARDLLKVSVIYLPLLLTTLMVCAIARH